MIPIYESIGLKAGHNGIDFAFPMVSPVYAAHDGEVVYAGVDSNEGYGIVIRTNEPFEYEDKEAFYKTIYWHLKANGIMVRVGQKVETGDLIALGDNTGLSTGSHLHFGLKPQYQGENIWTWWNAEQENGYKGAINPQPFFDGYYPEDIRIFLKIIELLKGFLKVVKIN